METIGCARPEELNDVLRVMCAAFGMDFARALPIFYSDPHLSPENKLVVRYKGQVVSCLSLSEHVGWVGDAQIRMAGVAGVATLPEFRRRGYATLLLDHAIDVLRKRGLMLAMLLPADAPYYGRRGWVRVGMAQKCRLLRRDLPMYPVSKGLRVALPRDAALLARAMPQFARGHSLRLQRTVLEWRRLLERPLFCYLYFDAANRLQGWLCYVEQCGTVLLGGQKEQPPVLQIRELYARTKEAQEAFVGHLARQKAFEQVEFLATPTDLQESGLEPYVLEREWVPNCMVRLLQMEGFLKALWAFKTEIPKGMHIPLAFSMKDIFPPVAQEQLLVLFLPSEAKVSSTSSLTFSSAPHRLEGFAQGWAEVLVGALDGEEACRSGKLQASSAEAQEMAKRLFPKREPCLLPLDHF